MYVADPFQIPNNVYMYTLHLTRLAVLTEGPTDAEKAIAAQHWAYSQDLLAKKIVIFGGRTLVMNEDSFGIVVIHN
jgi:hypothetical protein